MLEELRESDGKLSGRTRESLALEAFSYTARYDAAISRWFAEREEDFPAQYTRCFEKVLDLPYGENPHQRAAYYAEIGASDAPDSRWCPSSTARSCRSTTCSTSTPAAG